MFKQTTRVQVHPPYNTDQIGSYFLDIKTLNFGISMGVPNFSGGGGVLEMRYFRVQFIKISTNIPIFQCSYVFLSVF